MLLAAKKWAPASAAPVKAMMFGRINFEGPKVATMGNMGPFGNFLTRVGQVPRRLDGLALTNGGVQPASAFAFASGRCQG